MNDIVTKRRIADHSNDIGNWCRWSKVTVGSGYENDRCPAGCRSSQIEDIDGPESEA